MVRDIERDRDQYSYLITSVESFLKQDQEAHSNGFRRHEATWRRALLRERSRETLRLNLRWGASRQ